jgi:hypothetical protein
MAGLVDTSTAPVADAIAISSSGRPAQSARPITSVRLQCCRVAFLTTQIPRPWGDEAQWLSNCLLPRSLQQRFPCVTFVAQPDSLENFGGIKLCQILRTLGEPLPIEIGRIQHQLAKIIAPASLDAPMIIGDIAKRTTKYFYARPASSASRFQRRALAQELLTYLRGARGPQWIPPWYRRSRSSA